MTIWKWLLRTVFTIIILLMLIVCFLLTPYGFKFTFYVVEKMIPGQLHYQSANGMVPGPIHITQLDYENNGKHIHINKLDVDWSPLSLLRRKLHITHLTASGITIIIPKEKTNIDDEHEKKLTRQSLSDFLNTLKPYEPQPLQLPLSLVIDHAHIRNVAFGHSVESLNTVIKTIDVNGTIEANHINMVAKAQLLKPQPIFAILTAKGTLKHYQINLNLKDSIYHLTLHGEGNKNGMTISIAPSQLLNGTIQGTLKLAWYPQINWDIQLQLNKVDPRLLAKKLPKSVTLSLNTKGQLIKTNPIFDFTANLKADQATIDIQAHHHQLWDAKWTINIPNLEDLYAEAKGAIKTEGNLKGKNLLLPQTAGTISGTKIYYNDFNIGSINGNWKLFFDAINLSTFDLAINNIEYKERKLDVIQLNVKGHLLKHDLQATLDIGKHAIMITTRAHYSGKTWLGEITQFVSKHNAFGNWQLRNPAKFEYSPDKIYLNPLCLDANTGAFLCLQGNWQKGKTWNFSLTSKNFSFANLEKKAMINTQFTSRLSINAQATGIGSDIEHANINVDITPGMLTYLVGNQVVNTSIRPSNINLLINKKVGLSAKVNLNFAETDALKVNMSIPDFNDPDIPLKEKQLHTKINILMHDFRFVSLFEHVLKLSLGRLTGEFTLNGTVGDPKLEGDAQLKIPHFEYTTVKVHVQNIDAHIHADGQKLTYNLVGQAFNKAPVYFKGETDLSTPHAITHFEINAKNAEVIKNNQLNVFADTNIKFLLTHNALDIDGNVLITKARISPVDFSSTTEMPKANVVYIGLPKTEQPKATHKVNLNLKLTVGKDVIFKAYGINAHLSGGINLTMSPQQATIANGQVRITKGTFQAYGQYLELAKGSSVSFVQSPITNPFIDARAYKYVNTTTEGIGTQLAENNIIVGVHIQGTLRNMKFSLYSQPPDIAQADILSYLVLGYASGNTNPGSLSVLLDAANAMVDSSGGLNEPISLTDRIKQGLGIKELGVRNETVIDAIGNPIEDQSSFVVGDQLTKNIYLRYSRGMIVPDNIFTVEYHFNKNWILQTSTGSGENVGTGADIIYQIQTN